MNGEGRVEEAGEERVEEGKDGGQKEWGGGKRGRERVGRGRVERKSR